MQLLIGQGYCLVRTISKPLAYMPNVLWVKNGIQFCGLLQRCLIWLEATESERGGAMPHWGNLIPSGEDNSRGVESPFAKQGLYLMEYQN